MSLLKALELDLESISQSSIDIDGVFIVLLAGDVNVSWKQERMTLSAA